VSQATPYQKSQDWPDGLPAPRRYWAIAAIWLAITMAIIDGAIVSIALPTIARELEVSPAASIWVVNSYQIAVLVALLPLSSLGEKIGCSRVYLLGLVLFIVASAGCVLSTSLTALVIARFFQGVGGASIQAMNGALLRFTYPKEQLGRGIGYNTLVVAIASAAGPSAAAITLSLASWHWLFAVNIPIGLLSLAIGMRYLPSTPSADRTLDLTSMLLNTATFIAIFLAASDLAEGRATPGIALAAGAGVVAGVILVRRSRSQTAPLVPVDLLRLPLLRRSYAMSACSWAGQVMALVSLPFYLQGSFGLTYIETGLLITPWPVAVGIAAPIAGTLVERVPAAVLSSIGLALLAVGLCILAALPTDASHFNIAWPMAMCGAGFGLFQTPNNRILLSAAPAERTGAAGGMLAVARLVGQTSGAILVASLFRLAGSTTNLTLLLAASLFVVAAAISVRSLGDR
jgi:DHA2 family multidrug resistance protein-like MFS transporter